MGAARPSRRLRLWIAVPLLAGMAALGLPLLPVLDIASAAVAADYPSTIMGDTPISYWRMGGSQVDDEMDIAEGAANSNDFPAGAIMGDPSKATHYSGDQWALLGGPPQLRTPMFTVEAWFRTKAEDAVGVRPIYRYGGYGITLSLIDGKPMGKVYWGNTDRDNQYTTAWASASFADENWHHIAMTHDASTMRIYVDGGLVAYAPTPVGTAYSTATYNLQLAADPSPGGGTFKGDLDEIAYYDRPLSQDSLQAHYRVAGYDPDKPVGGAIEAKELLSGCNGSEPHLASSLPSEGAPVNTSTGNFWHSFAGLSVPGRGPALNFNQTYTAQLASRDGPMGFGWAHSYTASLTAGPTTVTVRQEDCSELTFKKIGGTYTAPPRVTATLARNADTTFTLTRSGGDRLNFDVAGRLASIKDRNDYATTLSYDGAGRLITITDPANRTLTLGYTGGRITTVTDTASPPRVLRFAYNPVGELTEMTDIGGGVWRFTYDAAHRMLTMLNPKQATSPTPVPLTNHYDAAGRVDWQEDFLGRRTSFDYVTTPGSTRVTDPKGNVRVYRYEHGIMRSLTVAAGTARQTTWDYRHDPATLAVLSVAVVSVSEPSSKTVATMSYDARGNRLSITDALNHKTSWTYGPFDNVTSVKDAKQITTTMTYDAKGNLKTTSTPLVPGTGNQTVTLNYDPARPGDVTSMVDPNAKTWTYTYNANGDLASAKDPVTPTAGTSTFCYDGIGRRIATISPKGTAAGVTCASPRPAAFTTYVSYNAFGDVVSVTDPLGHGPVNDYDAEGNIRKATDALGNETLYDYDSAGQLRTVTRDDGTRLRYDYWPDGALHHYYDGADAPTTYTYDEVGRLATEADPQGRTTAYAYDKTGNRRTLEQPGGNCSAVPKVGCITYGYDAADQLKSVTYSDGLTPNITNIDYDEVGQRKAMSDGTGTSGWEWDSLHRLIESRDGAGAVTKYGYDMANRLRSIVYPGGVGSVSRDYDEAGRLRTVTDWGNRTTTFTYDADGFMTKEAFPTAGTVDNFDPDGANRLMSSTAKTGTTTLASFTYGRDDANQLRSVASTGVPADNHSYSYTQLNQLKNLDGSAYGYSPADNLTTLASGVTQNYDTAHQLQNTVRGLAITNFGYDGRGNRTSRAPTVGRATSYRYDQADRLVATDATTFNDDVTVGLYHAAAARSDGTAWAWGYNAYGQLGNNTTTDSTVPVQVPGLSGVVAVAAGAYQSTALRADGTVWAWGSNGYGQLGNNSTVNSPVPVQVQGLSGVVAIAAGASHTLALRDDGSVWAWGYNANGQIGNATTTNALVPAQVQGLSGVTAIAGGYTSSYALKTDGSVWSWGYNGFGQLGNGTTTDATTPVQVQGLGSVGSLSAGWFHVLAARADGTAWAWGFNGYGALGNNTTVNSSSPVAVPGLSAVAAVIAGSYHSMALKADGSVATWGWNAYGQLANNTTADASVPQTVPALAGAKALAAGTYNGLAVRADRSAAAWGWNGVGAVGDATTTDRLVPVAVSGLNRGSTPAAAYAYNGDGLRTSKTVAGATKAFTWDLAQGLPLLLGDGDRRFVYGPGGRPISQIDAAGTVTYFHSDQLGSTRLLTNAAGAVVGAFTYDPYGNLTGRSGTATTALGFAGEYTDAETGFQYLRARYYDPTTGQFLSVDPAFAITGSRYGYVAGNPLNAIDPSGLCGTAIGPVYVMSCPLPTIGPERLGQPGAPRLPELLGTPAAAQLGQSQITRPAPATATNVCATGPGGYLVGKAPKQVTPGTTTLEGQYENDLGRIEPWTAYYDEYGRLIARTDRNAGNKAQGVPDVHHHTIAYGPGYESGQETGSHIPGEYLP